MTVNVFPVSNGTVQLTGSGERMIICSGDFTLVGSGGLFTTGSSSIHGLAAVAETGAWDWDGGVDATLDSPPVTSPFTCGSAVTGMFRWHFQWFLYITILSLELERDCTRCFEYFLYICIHFLFSSFVLFKFQDTFYPKVSYFLSRYSVLFIETLYIYVFKKDFYLVLTVGS